MLKVIFAIMYIGTEYYRDDVELLTGVRSKTISRAVGIIRNDFDSVDYKINRKYINGEWKTYGCHLDIGA